MSSVRIKRGTRAQIASAAAASGLRQGEPYLVTDEARIDIGTGTGTSEAMAKKSEVDSKAPSTTPTITGLREVKVAMAANNIDVAAGNLFTKTISGATTLTVSNVPAAGVVTSFILKLTNGGSATVTWFSGVKWPGGIAPVLTAAGRDNIYFESDDGGITWDGSILKDMK